MMRSVTDGQKGDIMEALQKYATSVANATSLEEISSAKDEYIKALEKENWELKKNALLVEAFIGAYRGEE